MATGELGSGGAGGRNGAMLGSAGGEGGDDGGENDMGAGGTMTLPDGMENMGMDSEESPSMSPQEPPMDGVEDAGAGESPSLPVADAGPPEAMVDSEFDIELVFESDEYLSGDVRSAFESATAIWESVIVGDVPDFESPRAPNCEANRIPTFVDDLIIYVRVAPIDGPEGILGAAGPCLIRGEGLPLPFAGRMEFDSEDLVHFAGQGRLEEIVLHEMGHVLGIGALWGPLDLLSNPAGQGGAAPDTAFDGSAALEAFEALGGEAYEGGAKVPVENSGGAGVANGHWRESVFGNELMTPFMSQLDGVLSSLTIASLEDLGYVVSYAPAGDYSWPPEPEPGRNPFGPAGAEPTTIDLSHDALASPVYSVDASGEMTRVR